MKSSVVRPLPRWADLAAICFGVAFLGWLAFFSRGDPALRDLLDTLFFLPMGSAVAYATWRTAQIWPHDAETRRAWKLIALSHLVTWLSGGLWTLLLIVRPAFDDSKLSDLPPLLAYPVVLWGVLSFPGLYRDGASRLRYVLDTVLILVGAGLGAWYFGYRLLLTSPDAAGNALFITFAYPAVELAIAAMTAASWQRASHPATRTALGWLLASRLASTAGDSWYGILRLTTGYYPGHWIDALWFGSWVFAWIAARSVQEKVARGTSAAVVERVRAFRREAVPAIFVLSAQGLLLWTLRDRLRTPAGVVGIAASLIAVLIVLRQLAELQENNRLFERERSQEARFRSLVQQGSDVLLVVDGAGAIVYRSPAAERLFGKVESIVTLFEPADADAPRALVERLLSGGSEGPVPAGFRQPDGALVHLEFVATDLRADPAVAGVVLMGRDVSERKALEDELLHAQKMRAIGQLAGGFAHDFNNILAGLRGHLDLLLDDLAPGAPERELTDEIAHAADRAAAITRQLLQFTRREVVRPATLDLNAVVAGLEPMLRQLLPQGVDLRVDCGPGPLWTFIDRSQLEQVVINLVVNARDAMAQGGQLLVRTATQRDGAAGDFVSLLVQDSGTGMDEETLSRIFEAFFTTKAPERGTGLGLATVQGNVTGAGGKVLVKSAPGLGSAFTVLLPRAEAASESAPAALPVRAAEGAGARVLVADDEETVLRVTARMLERKGYRVVQARNAESALQVFAAGTAVDLVLTDLMMGGMGGAGLLARLAEEHPLLPVVCMSGHAADEASRVQAASSAVSFLSKPFTADELFRAVAAALAAKRA